MQVVIKNSTTGIGLAYFTGDKVDLDETLAKELIETGFAEAIEEASEEIKTAEVKEPADKKKAVKK